MTRCDVNAEPETAFGKPRLNISDRLLRLCRGRAAVHVLVSECDEEPSTHTRRPACWTTSSKYSLSTDIFDKSAESVNTDFTVVCWENENNNFMLKNVIKKKNQTGETPRADEMQYWSFTHGIRGVALEKTIL